MENQSNVTGNQNIVIQGVTDSTITLNVNGENQEIFKRLDALQSLLEQQSASSLQTADKNIDVRAINEATFSFLMKQVIRGEKLPEDLAENLFTDDEQWPNSLKQSLIRQNVSVGNSPYKIFQHYGWLIETFLQKMSTAKGKERSLRRLSFMAEAFQSSLRYLCYIQIAQIIQLEEKPKNAFLAQFIDTSADQMLHFDFLNLLLITTDMMAGKPNFIKELEDFVLDIKEDEDLSDTVFFMEKHRNRLLKGEIAEDENLNQLLDEYLTALVYWFRQLAFIAKYRLVSIKDINLHYQVGSNKNFVHLYGELHGIYNDIVSGGEDYNSYSLQEQFTYNHSVLLFNGKNVEVCLENIESAPPLSLSPLVIDQSVYTVEPKNTPEIYYYSGKSGRDFRFAMYKNEMPLEGHTNLSSIKKIKVKRQNLDQPKLDELFEQLNRIFKPLKSVNR